jgi:small-conductance mechanosensitive channel
MPVLETLREWLLPSLPLLITVVSVAIVLAGAHWLLLGRHPDLGSERKFPRQLGMLALTILGVVALALALPVTDSTRNQVIGLVGLVISGMFAFSSTTIMANLMAGVMLRMTRPFRTGDFIRVETYFGRVAERGLLDTEIQDESRELIAIPNTYLIAHAVAVVRTSGTIVSTTLSLGYDVHHAKVEPLLLRAAQQAGLEEPFVHVLELGNYAITYRVSGLLLEVKNLLTARSSLCRAVLDMLHGAGIEIASPSIMNQRRLPENARLIPASIQPSVPAPPVSAEEIAFDKAEEAEQLEKEMKRQRREIEQLESALKGAPAEGKERIQSTLEAGRRRLQALQASNETNP